MDSTKIAVRTLFDQVNMIDSVTKAVIILRGGFIAERRVRCETCPLLFSNHLNYMIMNEKVIKAVLCDLSSTWTNRESFTSIVEIGDKSRLWYAIGVKIDKSERRISVNEYWGEKLNRWSGSKVFPWTDLDSLAEQIDKAIPSLDELKSLFDLKLTDLF